MISFKWRLISDIVTGLSTALFYANSIANEREKNYEQKRNGKRKSERERGKARENRGEKEELVSGEFPSLSR